MPGPVARWTLDRERLRLRLTEGSPAIDAATGALCPATDILYVARPLDGDGDGIARCDIGAYEYRDWKPTAWI